MRLVADVPTGTLASIVQRLNAEAIRIGASPPEAVAALISPIRTGRQLDNEIALLVSRRAARFEPGRAAPRMLDPFAETAVICRATFVDWHRLKLSGQRYG
jgi:hypothetical protein